MKIETFERNGALVAKLSGELDMVDSDDFAGSLTTIAQTKPRAVVLDLGDVSYMASQGLGLLVQFNRTVRAAGGHVTMCNVSHALFLILESVGITQLIPCMATLEDATARAMAMA